MLTSKASELVHRSKLRSASRRVAMEADRVRLAEAWGVTPGRSWVVRGLAEHRVSCGDGLSLSWQGDPRPVVLVFDPPWDQPISLPAHWTWDNALVFANGQHLCDVVRAFGAEITWQFIWDCRNRHITPARPLKGHKLCLWYGDVKTYRWRRDKAPRVPTAALLPNGAKLSDLYAESLVTVTRDARHPHAKPLAWMRALLGGTAPDHALVVDPFAGSGTSLLASDALGMSSVSVESDVGCVARILERAAASGLTVDGRG